MLSNERPVLNSKSDSSSRKGCSLLRNSAHCMAAFCESPVSANPASVATVVALLPRSEEPKLCPIVSKLDKRLRYGPPLSLGYKEAGWWLKPLAWGGPAG